MYARNLLVSTLTIIGLAGCSTTPSVPSDVSILSNNELCEAFGIAYAAKDTSTISSIIEEGESRGITENETCKMFAEIGFEKYVEAKNSPSSFETFISTVDAIGTAGHTQNHNVTIK